MLDAGCPISARNPIARIGGNSGVAGLRENTDMTKTISTLRQQSGVSAAAVPTDATAPASG